MFTLFQYWETVYPFQLLPPKKKMPGGKWDHWHLLGLLHRPPKTSEAPNKAPDMATNISFER